MQSTTVAVPLWLPLSLFVSCSLSAFRAVCICTLLVFVLLLLILVFSFGLLKLLCFARCRVILCQLFWVFAFNWHVSCSVYLMNLTFVRSLTDQSIDRPIDWQRRRWVAMFIHTIISSVTHVCVCVYVCCRSLIGPVGATTIRQPLVTFWSTWIAKVDFAFSFLLLCFCFSFFFVRFDDDREQFSGFQSAHIQTCIHIYNVILQLCVLSRAQRLL